MSGATFPSLLNYDALLENKEKNEEKYSIVFNECTGNFRFIG